MDDEPVSRNAMNLVTAMPRFANSAATTAFVPPSVLTTPPLRSGAASFVPDLSRAYQLLHLGHSAHGHGAEAVRESKVNGGEVRHGHERRQSFQSRTTFG